MDEHMGSEENGFSRILMACRDTFSVYVINKQMFGLTLQSWGGWLD